MKIILKNTDASTVPADALILPVAEDRNIGEYAGIDASLNGLIRASLSSGEFRGQHRETLLLHTQGNVRPARILLVGLGKRRDLTEEKVRQAGGASCSRLSHRGIGNVALSAKLFPKLKGSAVDFLEGFLLAGYTFDAYRADRKGHVFKSLTLLSRDSLKKNIKETETIAAATFLARDLVNTPSNDMTPSALLRTARSLKGVTIKVVDRREAEKMGMGAYTSVARGSKEPPRFIVITYKKKKSPPVVLVGKSITFDSGGISLKPPLGMEKMKYDMAGGAAVLGVMKALTELQLPLHVVAILPATENLPGGSAYKPGDVVTALEGKTIEIISTDAEGRLALADAIGYAKKFKPSAIVDIATLTGACSIALGDEAMAMFGNDPSLNRVMQKASDACAERVWPMPLYDEYLEYIKSDIADLKNSAGRSGSLVTAGAFLKEFAGSVPWIHLDIAGTAWTDRERPYVPRGATGVGVRLLVNFLALL